MIYKANDLIDWINIIQWPYLFYPVFLLPSIYDIILWNTESRDARFHKVGMFYSGRFQILNSLSDGIVCTCFLINYQLLKEVIEFKGDRNGI